MDIRNKNLLCFAAMVTTAFLLFYSWVNPVTGYYWRLFDINAFYFFNGWLEHSSWVQVFWSVTNFRAFDLLPVGLIIFSVTASDVFLDKNTQREKIILFLLLIIVMLTIRFTASAIYDAQRHSPSIVLSNAYLLTSLVPYIHAKDFALDSFPSDHAAVMLTWMSFMLLYAKTPYKFLAVILGIFFCLPRLVAGAHWITDMVVGSTCVTLLSVALVCFTPLGAMGVDWIMSMLLKIRRPKVINEQSR